MKITFKKTPEQIELIRDVGSHDKATSANALTALAAFVTPIVQAVIRQAGSAGMVYRDIEFNEDDSPSIPLDLFYTENTEEYITTWSQTIAGGLPTSQIEGVAEMKISTYRLDTAISWLKKYARRSRLDVVAKGIERMAQEILLKQERNAWAVILKALCEARTNSLYHVIDTGTESIFMLSDLSALMTRIRRINTSWAGGTPAGLDSVGLTDLFVSPEIKEQIRAFAYNPMNTVGAGGATLGASDVRGNGVPLPDGVREEIYRSAGTSEIYGVNITELLELGVAKRYTSLYSEFAGSDTSLGVQGGAFDASTDEVCVGFDLTRDSFLRPVATNAEGGGTFTTLPDDQFVARSEKVGLYGFLEEGRVCVDARGVCGLTV